MHSVTDHNGWSFLLFLPAWIFGSFILSFAGWRTLSKKYVGKLSSCEKSFSLKSAYMGFCSYKNCLLIKVGEEGLGLSVLFPFRLFHPPLLIPWNSIQKINEGKTIFRKKYLINIDGLTLTLYGNCGEYVFNYFINIDKNQKNDL